MVADQIAQQLFSQQDHEQQDQQRPHQRTATPTGAVGLELVSPLVAVRHAGHYPGQLRLGDSLQGRFGRIDIDGGNPFLRLPGDSLPAGRVAARNGGVGQPGLQAAGGRGRGSLPDQQAIGWQQKLNIDPVDPRGQRDCQRLADEQILPSPP